MKIRINKKLSAFLRIFVALALLGFLVYRNLDNFQTVFELLLNIRLNIFLLGFFLYFCNVSLETLRWKGLLASKDIRTGAGYLLSSVYVGFFFNNLLPTSVGGDAYRAIDVHKRYETSLSANISAIMIGRFLNVFAGFLFLSFSIIAGMHRELNRALLISFAVMIPFIFLLALLVFFPSLFKIDRLFARIPFLRRFEKRFKNFVDVLESFKKKKGQLVIAFLYSLAIILLWYTSYYVIGRSLGIDARFLVFLFVLPLSSTVANLPISMGGMGVRENAIVYLFTYFLVAQEKALALSLLILGSNLVIAFLGGIIYLGKKLVFQRRPGHHGFF